MNCANCGRNLEGADEFLGDHGHLFCDAMCRAAWEKKTMTENAAADE